MKLFALFSLLFSVHSHAINQMRHVCESVKGGQFWHSQRADDKLNDLPLCKFDMAQIGALTLLENDTGKSTSAVAAYVNRENECKGQVVTGINGAHKVQVCEYTDGSTIELNTLFLGPSDSRNEFLNQALGL